MHSHRRSPKDLLRQSLDWIKKTGWQTQIEDRRIADQVFQSWIADTNDEWLATHHRNRELLSDALEVAFRPIRDDRAADCLYALFMMLLELRGRREGILQRVRNH